MQNLDSNLRPKTSASFYNKTGVQLFFVKNLKWPLLNHRWQWKDYGDNWAPTVDVNLYVLVPGELHSDGDGIEENDIVKRSDSIYAWEGYKNDLVKFVYRSFK